MAKRKQEAESESFESQPASESSPEESPPPVAKTLSLIVVNKMHAPDEAVAALRAAFPEAKLIVVQGCGKREIVGEVDSIPRKVVWKPEGA